jgi:hypothetical protein
MYARVMSTDLPSDKIDVFISTMRDQVIPRASKLQGFKGGYWLVDRENGKAMGVTLYESEAALLASQEAANRIREEVSRNMGLPVPSFEHFEVVASVEIPVRMAA